MNKQMEQVSGVVMAVGDKFNGSVKVNGVWYSNKKGFKNPAKVGDTVTLELSSWEFEGKKGLNITGVSVKEQPKDSTAPSKAVPEMLEKKADKVTGFATTGRDYDAENRGKVRHGLTVALVPLVAQNVINVDKLKELVNNLVEYVMLGE